MQWDVLVCIVALAASSPHRAWAEAYNGIVPRTTLGQVKAKFPGGKFERVSPAWAKEHDAMYEITGEGLPGTIIILFFDQRPEFRRWVDSSTTSEMRTLSTYLAEQSDDDALQVVWVRWVPDVPIPVARMSAKFGKPDEKGYTDDDMSPYIGWKRRGLTAFLSDDEKAVIRIDYTFTEEDWRAVDMTERRARGRKVPTR